MMSIIVPVHNGEQVIGKCLDALHAQDYHGQKEIIVVDDGSIDRTVDEVERFSSVRLITQPHRGPAAARNRGARAARGDVLLFIDADCEADTAWLKEMASLFSEKSVAGVQGEYRTRQTSLVARFAQREIENRYERMKQQTRIDFIGTYSAAYRREIFLRNDGFYEGFSAASGEDPDLSFRLAKQGYRLVLNPRAMVFHRHPETVAAYARQKFYRAYWRVLLYRRHKEKMIADSYTPQSLKLQVGLLYLIGVLLILLAFIVSLFSIPLIGVLGTAIGLLCISTLPESFRNGRKERAIGLVSPVLLLVRTVAFALGLIAGTVSLMQAAGRRVPDVSLFGDMELADYAITSTFLLMAYCGSAQHSSGDDTCRSSFASCC